MSKKPMKLPTEDEVARIMAEAIAYGKQDLQETRRAVLELATLPYNKAMTQARKIIKEQIKKQGQKITYFSAKQITNAAMQLRNIAKEWTQ